MATTVGLQHEFYDALYSLCELDYDAVEAYKTAIHRLESKDYQNKLREFMQDHLQHIETLEGILKKHNKEVPKGPDLKQYLAQGKVILANMFGDKGILTAMLTNEKDTNLAYDRLNIHKGKWEDAVIFLRKGLDDERRHKQWIETTIKTL